MKQGRLADRLEKLESATEGWRKRVTTADAVQFSVAGKMRFDQIDSLNTTTVKPIFESMGNCVSERKKKVPKTKKICRGSLNLLISIELKIKIQSIFTSFYCFTQLKEIVMIPLNILIKNLEKISIKKKKTVLIFPLLFFFYFLFFMDQ